MLGGVLGVLGVLGGVLGVLGGLFGLTSVPMVGIRNLIEKQRVCDTGALSQVIRQTVRETFISQVHIQGCDQ